MDQFFDTEILPIGSKFNHERHFQTPLEQHIFHQIPLFWTSPNNISYYNSGFLFHSIETTTILIGIKIKNSISPSDVELGEIPIKCLDAFAPKWLWIFTNTNIDFINLYDNEYIFSPTLRPNWGILHQACEGKPI